MGNKKQVEKWIDLSILPKQKSRINWEQSVGCEVPFKYGDIQGKINIVGCFRKNTSTYLMITIKDYVVNPIAISSGSFCNCRISHLVHNRIADINKDLIIYFDNPNDAFKYALNSGQYAHMHCPLCQHKKYMRVCDLSTNGFCCPICGDGVSYPNKFIAALLSQLNIEFMREASKKDKIFFWAKKYRYDFYFQANHKNIIVEADGGQHNNPIQQCNDRIKDDLAQSNGFHMIRIDCDYKHNNRFEYIKERVLSSELNQIFDMSHVDWRLCNTLATGSLVKDACDLWDKGYAISEIGEILNISIWTVTKYLKRGKELGICISYNKKESKHRAQSNFIWCCDADNRIYVFKDIDEAVQLSKLYFGKQFSPSGIRCVCNGYREKYYNMFFKYITKAEYLQYKMNEVNKARLGEVV